MYAIDDEHWSGAKKTDGKRTAIIVCPLCKKQVSLSGHTIKSDGHVSPSLVCPHNECNFHDYIKLDNWSE